MDKWELRAKFFMWTTGVLALVIILSIVSYSIESNRYEEQYEKIEKLDYKCYFDACANSYDYGYDAYEGMCYCYNEYGEQTHKKQYPYLQIQKEE